jgi:DNA (cytosine-5)-methyltransferase 1
MLCGGFPCQSWSIAGKREGFEYNRGTLFYEIIRIIHNKKPKYVLLENVKGILSHNGGKSFENIMESLCDLGYVVDFTVLNSKYFGVPQNRERVFILCIREDLIKDDDIF